MKTWKDIVDDLLESGLSKDELAVQAETTIGVLNEILAGRTKEPRGMAAVRLHQLHALRCGAGVARSPAEPTEPVDPPKVAAA